jgi:hypothetical protein
MRSGPQSEMEQLGGVQMRSGPQSEMEIAPDKGWKRDPNTGLWVPDIAKAAEAKANCKFCHGKGEMLRSSQPYRPAIWTVCLCVVKRFPQGKKNTARLRKTEKRMQRR